MPTVVSIASRAETALGASQKASGFSGHWSHAGSGVGSTRAIARDSDTSAAPTIHGKEALETRLEAARRVGEEKCGEGDEGEPAEDESRDVDPRSVRLGEGAEEPQKSDPRQVDPGAVLRSPPERDETGDHERDARDDGERVLGPELGFVVARLGERDRQGHLERNEGGAECESQTTQARSAATSSPESSPLGTNPHAQDVAMSSP